jgi:putative hydrolase of the HAD superfamily
MQEIPVDSQLPNLAGIRAVILDYGKVIAHSATREDFERMAQIFNVSFDTFFKLWENTRDPYDRGDVTPEEYWLGLAVKTNSSIDENQIRQLRQIEVEIWLHIDPAMIAWMTQLREKGIKLALLSNMPVDLIEYLRTNAKWLENFDFQTFSAEVRLIKPDQAIYEYTLRGLGVPASEALFVDDRETNVQSARALGIRGIVFQSIGQLRDELERLHFPVLPVVPKTSGTDDSPKRDNKDPKFSALL